MINFSINMLGVVQWVFVSHDQDKAVTESEGMTVYCCYNVSKNFHTGCSTSPYVIRVGKNMEHNCNVKI